MNIEESVDRAIDDEARAMMDVEPGARLREHVADRLTGRRLASGGWWIVAAPVTVVVLVVLAAVVGRSPSGSPATPDLSTVALPAPLEPAEPVEPPPSKTSAPREPPEPRVLLRIPVQAALAPVAPIAEGIDPIEIEQLNASELSVAPLEPPMTITFDAIDIEPLAVQ